MLFSNQQLAKMAVGRPLSPRTYIFLHLDALPSMLLTLVFAFVVAGLDRQEFTTPNLMPWELPCRRLTVPIFFNAGFEHRLSSAAF